MEQGQVREADDLETRLLNIKDADTKEYPPEHVLEEVERIVLTVRLHVVVQPPEIILKLCVLKLSRCSKDTKPNHQQRHHDQSQH